MALGDMEAWLHGSKVAIDGKCDIDKRNKRSQDIPDVDGLLMVSLGDVERWGWHNLLPAKAHVCAEDRHSADVEENPPCWLRRYRTCVAPHIV